MSIQIDHTNNTITGTSSVTLQPANTFGYKNRIINGSMNVQQRGGTAVTYNFAVPTTTASPSASIGYGLDRWFVIPSGAAVTMNPVLNANAYPHLYTQQITGSAANTGILLGQRIEQQNSYDLAGNTATLSFWMANSLLTTANWTVSYANTADAFGTIAGTAPSPTKTQIATGSVSISSTWTKYTVQINIPAAATTGIEILFSVGGQTSGTWKVTGVQLEKGAIATDFDIRPIQTELLMCMRYFEVLTYPSWTWSGYSGTAGSANNYGSIPFKVRKRVTPTTNGSFSAGNVSAGSFINSSVDGTALQITNTNAGSWYIYNNNTSFSFSSEL
jgi:hypothetical protein